jgi:hypothetical protein
MFTYFHNYFGPTNNIKAVPKANPAISENKSLSAYTPLCGFNILISLSLFKGPLSQEG